MIFLGNLNYSKTRPQVHLGSNAGRGGRSPRHYSEGGGSGDILFVCRIIHSSPGLPASLEEEHDLPPSRSPPPPPAVPRLHTIVCLFDRAYMHILLSCNEKCMKFELFNLIQHQNNVRKGVGKSRRERANERARGSDRGRGQECVRERAV